MAVTKIKIKNRWNGNVLFSYECEGNTLRITVEKAVTDGASLVRASLHYQICPEEGSFVAFKKLGDQTVAKLLIPAKAKRTSSYIGRKCRAEFVDVIEGEGRSLTNEFTAVEYKSGQTVRPDSYDPDPRVQCSHGIHFFVTRKEPEEFTM